MDPLITGLGIMLDPGAGLPLQDPKEVARHPLTMNKLRSMWLTPRISSRTRARGRGCWQQGALPDEQHRRVMPVRRIMRKLSLDELPQLFNALGGSMSLVGRGRRRRRRWRSMPIVCPGASSSGTGIIDLWQMNVRSTLSWDDTVRLDLS
jgi:lipopolysaccharide/colanic/teichoic acid biosynthesis glycosyltransferase